MLNREFLLLFILAHLLGDYALQTDYIAKVKTQGIKGIALHTLIVGAAQVILLSVFGVRGILTGLAGAVLHFFVDWWKLYLGRRMKHRILLLYLMDQVLHLLIIVMLTLWMAPEGRHAEQEIQLIQLSISAILILFTSTVTVKTVLRSFYPELRKQNFFEIRERWIDALSGLVLYAFFWIHPVLAVAAMLSGIYGYNQIQKKFYSYTWQMGTVKYVVIDVFVLFSAFLTRC